jgi:FtsZ-interacting cell division protein ZipA
MYENKSYYSKLLSKIINLKNKGYSTRKKKSIKTYTNNNINNINTKRNYINSYYMNNLLTNNTNNNDYNLNMNNPKNEPQYYNTKAVFSPTKNDEIMTVENNTKGKTIHIIKKRNKSPQINQSYQQTSPESKKQTIKTETQKQDNEKEQIKEEKKEHKNNLREVRGIIEIIISKVLNIGKKPRKKFRNGGEV